MSKEIISKIKGYLEDENNYKWTTSKTLLKKLNIKCLSPMELDDILVEYFQGDPICDIRFSTYPSIKSLDILWGSVKRNKLRDVSSIYRQDEQVFIEELGRTEKKNMFLSHSFKDSKLAIKVAKKFLNYNVFTWLAEVEILKNGHINQSVIEAIEELPFFCVLITKNIVNSVWSAKEIGFALTNKKEVIGIIDAENIDFVKSIEDVAISGGTKISQDIFRRFFDNHSKVKFLYYPSSKNVLNSHSLDPDHLIDWDYYKNYMYY